MKKGLALMVFCFSAMCATVLFAASIVTIPPDDGLKQIKDNPLLAMTDQQFRPFAELLMKSRESYCTKVVFLGDSAEWQSYEQDKPDTIAGTYYRSAAGAHAALVSRQQDCFDSVRSAAQILGNKIDAFKNMKPLNAMHAGHKILDPRVYERAKKMMGKATPAKPKN